MLDEKALRKPDFQEGIKIVLGDKQEWSFPMPKIRLVPYRDNGEWKKKAKLAAGECPELTKCYETLWNLGQEYPPNIWEIRFAATAHLLQLNYNLTDEDLGDLIYVDRNDDESTKRWGEIEGVLMGIRPKEPTSTTPE